LKFILRSMAAAAILFAGPLYSQETEEALDDARDFDLPASEMADMVGDGGLDLGDVDFEGSPLKSLAEKWPEDLVVAPIPGRSPQLGWQLTLGVGYFLESKDETSDKPPSIVGGFGMTAENGSYAYGGGAYLHLLDDDLRVKAGATYADIYYEFFGVGTDINRLDFSDFGDYYLPAAGVGTRFVLSKKHRVGLSFDVAKGKTGTEYYVGVGEAF